MEVLESLYPDGIGRYPESVPKRRKGQERKVALVGCESFCIQYSRKSVMNYGNGGVVLMGTIPLGTPGGDGMMEIYR